jgi:hypothetical protein
MISTAKIEKKLGTEEQPSYGHAKEERFRF